MHDGKACIVCAVLFSVSMKVTSNALAELLLMKNTIFRNHHGTLGTVIPNSTTHLSCKGRNPNTHGTLDHIMEELVTEISKLMLLT